MLRISAYFVSWLYLRCFVSVRYVIINVLATRVEKNIDVVIVKLQHDEVQRMNE